MYKLRWILKNEKMNFSQADSKDDKTRHMWFDYLTISKKVVMDTALLYLSSIERISLAVSTAIAI